jgi:DNA-3-methyladenine glycosylase I
MSCNDWCHVNKLMEAYHDTEWGVPLFDDPKQFEFLMMEALQCGLSWNLIMQKREILRHCFAGFDPKAVADFSEKDVQRILDTKGMIRSVRKIRAIIYNARAFLVVQKEFGSFSRYLWHFTNGFTYLYKGHEEGHLPASNGLSLRISRDLKKRGFSYLGPVTVYSHLQACGIINDHDRTCPRYRELLQHSQVRTMPPDNEVG